MQERKWQTVNKVHKGNNAKQCCFFRQYTFNPISETHLCQFRLAPAYVACDYWHATGCEARPVQEMSNFQPKIQDLFPIHKNITTIQQAERYVITAATVTSFTNDHHIKEQSSKRQWEKKKQGTVMRNELGHVMQVPFFIKDKPLSSHPPNLFSFFFLFAFFYLLFSEHALYKKKVNYDRN